MSELMEMRTDIRDAPLSATLESSPFPIVESYAGGRKVLVLPPQLRIFFEKNGAHIVRINSLELAVKIPNFGSETSGSYSFLAHKDNFGDDEDPKRYLVLTKATHGARGASTFVCMPEVAEMMLRIEERFFRAKRIVLGNERQYNDKFQISNWQYDFCFDDPNGYTAVIAALLARPSSPPETTVRLNLLNYLMRGPSVDPLMEELMRDFGAVCFKESWERGGVLIVDNVAVFHGRIGGSYPPLERNFCI